MVSHPLDQGHFGTMSKQDTKFHKGKKMDFDPENNASYASNMYPVADKKGEQDLYFKRTSEDYCNKHGVEYHAPPVVKNYDKKHSFVHNCIENKNKTNIAHFE